MGVLENPDRHGRENIRSIKGSAKGFGFFGGGSRPSGYKGYRERVGIQKEMRRGKDRNKGGGPRAGERGVVRRKSHT